MLYEHIGCKTFSVCPTAFAGTFGPSSSRNWETVYELNRLDASYVEDNDTHGSSCDYHRIGVALTTEIMHNSIA
jgi:hypothetical protein